MLELQSPGGVPLLTDGALFRACGVRIAFTGRDGGVSEGVCASLNTAGHVGDDPLHVEENRRRALAALGGGGALLVSPNQVHGADVLVVRQGDGDARVFEAAAGGVDAVAVEAANVAVLMNFADCLPLVIASPTGRFAVAHAGWRGALAGIAGKAARALARLDAGGDDAQPGCPSRGGKDAGRPRRDVGDPASACDDGAGDEGPSGLHGSRAAKPECRAAAFNVYLGPHIRSECFEVGDDVAERFAAAFGPEVVTGQGNVSLAGAVTCDLVRAGVDAARIADAGICTKCRSDRYFSYRASNGSCGRHAAIAFRMP